MHTFFRRAWLPATVFITGACVLVLELAAIRILAPYFGNTLYSASSVISVVLAALSVGYWFGGKLADRNTSVRLFFSLIAASGILVILTHYLQSELLPLLGYRLPLASGSLIMAIVLFFIPSFILGLLSPFAVALQQKQQKKQGVGTTAGQIFFFSTLGSIAGSLMTGFVLVPLFGVSSIMMGTGLALCLLGIIPMAALGVNNRVTMGALLLAGSLGVVATTVAAQANHGYLHVRDGMYEKIMVFDGIHNGRPARFLQQDSNNSAAMYLDSDELTYGYTKYYALHQMFVPEVRRALAIGGGAYSVPKALLAELPDVRVDASEIEPALPELAREYFRLPDDPRLTHYVMDGRRMLHDSPHKYDMIFSDVYQSLYSVPSHFTTKEFMQLARDRLSDDGMFMANLIGSLRTDTPSFIWSQVRTMQEVFPQVYVFAVSGQREGTQNIIAVGSNNPKRVDVSDPRWRASSNLIIAGADRHYVDTSDMDMSKHLLLTDNYAPVDYLTSKVLPKR